MTYCGQCGEKLEKSCPKCNFVNPPQFKFCGHCGHDLTLTAAPLRKELSPDEKLEKIQKYFPQGIMEKILSKGDKVEGERRRVTVLFADISGFTPMSEMMEPEEVTGIMNRCFSMIGECIEKHGGTIDKFMGDCMMALFGAPIALEDAPQRAIRSAIMIHREMTQFNDRLTHEKENIKPLRMRIGVHTGPVVAGMVGSDGKQDFTVMGDTVNLASRMEGLAEPGTTYVTEDTFRLTEGFFRFEALGEKKIKGKEKPIRVYQVIAPSTRRTRFDVSTEHGLTPFVGRQRELELLIDGYERSKEGRGQAISIISEAGIGKSRLLYEFRKAVTNEDATFLEGRCLSYSTNIAYHPIVDILRATFDIQDTDTDEKIRQKVTQFLKVLQIDAATHMPYLLELLAVKESGIEKIPMSPEARKDRTLEALKQITIKGSELRPLIMAIEDLHWTDRSSEDALKNLLESIAGSRVFLIFTYRPEFVHTWGNRSYHSQITLNRLSNRESLLMVEHLLDTKVLDKDIAELTLSKTEGIPFFIEEFIKSLKELKIIEKQNGAYKLTTDIKIVTMPSTIQDVIMARVDHLPEGSRELLRTGAVIEREFSHELIGKVTGLPEQDLLSRLSTLKDSELIYERGIYPNNTYIFKHALTREVVYDSILTKKRKEFHQKIANTIEDIYREEVCYHYGVLAGHCIAGENFEKGAEYARLEARRYQKAASYKDAVSYAKKSIACLERLAPSEHIQKKIIDTRVMLSKYYGNMTYHIEAKEAVEPIVDLALSLNYQKRIPSIYNAIGLYYLYVEEDFSTGVPYLKNAFERASQVNDMFTLLFGNFILGCTMLWDLQIKESLDCLKTSVDLSVMANDLTGIANTKSTIAMNYFLQGKTNLALQASQEALHAAESGDIIAKQVAYGNYGVICYYRGHLPEAEKYLLEALAYLEKAFQLGWGAWAVGFLGWTYHDMGDYDKAKKYFQQCASILEDARFCPSWLNCQKLLVINNGILNGEPDIDINGLGGLINAHEQCKLAMSESFESRCIGEIFLNIDNQHMSEAEAWIKRSIDFDVKHAIPWNLGKDYTLYADWFKKKGDMEGTKEQLTKAINLFRECDADGWVTRTENDLAAIC
jgi:class 3 adenylate cyclase/tetratricopeptide (TPR) repeat protein